MGTWVLGQVLQTFEEGMIMNYNLRPAHGVVQRSSDTAGFRV